LILNRTTNITNHDKHLKKSNHLIERYVNKKAVVSENK
jgi:hypothetical protein